MPGMQSSQVVAFLSETVPALQSLHTESPVRLPKVPGTHAGHALRPVVFAKKPAAQGGQNDDMSTGL